ncbi:MAG: TolB family protein [Anaerolineae bacterium]
MDWDGNNLHQLAQGSNPTWSPDGRRIAYTDPQGALWVINLDGTGARPIVEADQNPLWYEPYWCR